MSRSSSPLQEEPDFEEDGLLVEKEVDEALQPASSRRVPRWNASGLWWLSNVLMAIALLYLGAEHRARRNDIEVAGDVNGIWPKLSKETVTFQPDNRFVGNLTSPDFKDQTHNQWLGLVPKGLGFIEVPNPSHYPALSPPYIKYNKPVYTTSATHQLHCLYMIMTGMNELALNHGRFVHNMASGGEHDEGLTREGEDPAEHLAHCFDYLRQAIMCHGDVALEGLQTTFGQDVGGSDGWNVKHVCRKWEEVYAWLERERIDDRTWI